MSGQYRFRAKKIPHKECLPKFFRNFLDFAGKIFGKKYFDRKIFGIFNFRAYFFFVFQLSTGNFLGFSNFKPEKIPENSDRGRSNRGWPTTLT